MIYFIQDTHTKHIKIGIATSLKARLSGLQTGNPNPLICLATMRVEDDNDTNAERNLHKMFAEYWCRGEWFTPGDHLLRFIESIPISSHAGLRASEPTWKNAQEKDAACRAALEKVYSQLARALEDPETVRHERSITQSQYYQK